MGKKPLKIVPVILSIICWGFLSAHAQNDVTKSNTIVIDGEGKGRTFQGIGAISAGASSRLLYDYPEPEQSQILDYLFKPDYGASIQILKVEIGGDMNSTSGSEASHMRSPADLNCNRGYEWWLMKEAKARNPNIKLAGLQWGIPGWIEEFWSKKNINYLLAWLGCVEENGLQIDYMGGWNERGWNIDWFIALDQALQRHYPDVKIIAADAVSSVMYETENPWAIAADMKENPGLMQAVDVIGAHSPCGWRTGYRECTSGEDARNTGKPLWNSEHSSMGHDVGAAPLARAMNRLYIDAQITGNLAWSLISAWYANMRIADTGLMLAEWPWSGYYQVGKSIWAYAHTAQFTEPGWSYIDTACGYLSSGASYVLLQSPSGSDYTIVIEAMDVSDTRQVEFSVTGGLPAEKPVQVWATDLRSDNLADYFVRRPQIQPENGEIHFTVHPGYVYTLSTTIGQKGSARPEADIAGQLPLPFEEDFEGYEKRKMARYFSDINGAFEVTPCGGGRNGFCYRQVVTQAPVKWWHDTIQPATMAGDSRWWGDYRVSVDALLEQPGYVELIGRISAQQLGTRFAGYHLRVSSAGRWKLYRHDLKNQQQDEQILASGSVSFEVGKWHRLALSMKGEQISVLIDGKQVGSIRDSYHRTGQIALMVSPWHNAQFDNVTITRTRDWPDFVPHKQMTVTATSDHPENYRGYDYTAYNAIDGRPETVWHSEWQPKAPLPQSITLDLGGSYRIQGLTYQPRLDDNTGGMITEYNIYLSSDGETFDKVTSGSWRMGTGTKIATWPGSPEARYVRLEAVKGGQELASAGEINVILEQSKQLLNSLT